MKSFKHAGKIGDLIYALPAIREVVSCKKKAEYADIILLKNRLGHQSFPAELVVPLLEIQPFIASISIVDMQGTSKTGPDTDYDFIPFAQHRLVFSQHLIQTMGETIGLLDVQYTPWLICEPNPVAEVVVTRRSQQQGGGDWTSVYKEVQLNKAIFLGTEEEHLEFERLFGKIWHRKTKDFLEAAQIIQGCNQYIGDPTALYAIAVGLGKKVPVVNGMLPNVYYPTNRKPSVYA